MKTYSLNSQVQLFRFGNPVRTDSLSYPEETMELQPEPFKIPFFNESFEEKSVTLKGRLKKTDKVLGLGESVGSVNKRGRWIESYATDDPIHTPDKSSLYGAHNYLFITGDEHHGFYIDFPGKVIYDIGYHHPDEIEIKIEGLDFDLYHFKHDSLKNTIKLFRMLQGEGYVPPKWAFGNQQSRWSYETADIVKEVADTMRKKGLPCDAIYLDIDYMEDYKNFTVDETRFPDFGTFVDEMKNDGFRLIPIIDAGVKVEKNYQVYEEGVNNHYFCKNEKNEPFLAAVWPGWVHFPDFQIPEVRKWFGHKYEVLTDFGIEGFWNDMNEPAIFYTEEKMKEFTDKVKSLEGKNLNLQEYFELNRCYEALAGDEKDYKNMFQKIDGQMISHHQIHNLYGYNMTRAAAEGLRELAPNKRHLLFSRSSYTGMGRYAGLWTGDNHSWWEHIPLMLKMMPALNMGGFMYIGADIGGFGGDANAALLIRWSQASLLTPLYRNHSAKYTRSQEPYAFDEKTTDTMRKVLELRYSLIPYIYSEYMKATLNQDLYFKLLSFEYEDDHSKEIEDQLLVGESVMIAPVYEENAKGRYVWVPEEMLLWKKVINHQDEFQVVSKGHHYMHLEMDETSLFVRKNKMIILAEPAQNVDSMDFATLTVLAFVEDTATYYYYDDDGESMNYKTNKANGMMVKITLVKDQYEIDVSQIGESKVHRLNLMIANVKGELVEYGYDVKNQQLI